MDDNASCGIEGDWTDRTTPFRAPALVAEGAELEVLRIRPAPSMSHGDRDVPSPSPETVTFVHDGIRSAPLEVSPPPGSEGTWSTESVWFAETLPGGEVRRGWCTVAWDFAPSELAAAIRIGAYTGAGVLALVGLIIFVVRAARRL